MPALLQNLAQPTNAGLSGASPCQPKGAGENNGEAVLAGPRVSQELGHRGRGRVQVCSVAGITFRWRPPRRPVSEERC